MTDVKYEVVSPDEEIAVTGVKAFSPGKTSTKSRSVWKTLLKYFLILSLAVVIVFCLLGAAVYHCGHHLVNKVGGVVIPQVTTEHPLALPKVHLDKHEIHGIQKRLHEFKHDLHHDRTPPQDLVLTEKEINGLICDDDDMCGHVYATIMDNVVKADFSFPADKAPGGKSRYFVGHKTLVSVPDENKESSYHMQHTFVTRGPHDEEFTVMNVTGTMDLVDVDVEIQSAEVMGWMATDAFVQRFLQGRNFAGHMCHHAKDALKHIDGVTIGDGKIVVHVK